MAHHREARRAEQHHTDLPAVPWPELNPVENIWQFLRGNWLSNLVFETYDDIIDAACDAWRKLVAQPETITSIGMREWAHIVYLRLLVSVSRAARRIHGLRGRI